MSKDRKPKFILFHGLHEIITCKRKDEDKIISLFFENGGRNIDDYDREEIFDDFVVTKARITFDV